MSDDINKKIKQISEILSQEDGLPDNIKGLLSLFTNSDSRPTPSENTDVPKSTQEAKSGVKDLEENIEMMRKVKKVMDKVSSNSDPRINLLTAVKPFLNTKRQQTLGSCVKLLYMYNMTRFLDDQDILKGGKDSV